MSPSLLSLCFVFLALPTTSLAILESPFTVSSTGPATMMGDYFLTDRTLNNCPVYEKTGGHWFLYVGNNGSWAISSDVQSAPNIYHPENNPTPSSPPGTGWRYYDDGWRVDDQLTVTRACVNDDRTADSADDTCSDYYDDNKGDCGEYDTNTFNSSVQCCACGGSGINHYDTKFEEIYRCVNRRNFTGQMPCYPYIEAVAEAANVNRHNKLDRTEFRNLRTELHRIANQAQNGRYIDVSTPITRALDSVDNRTAGTISRGELVTFAKELQVFECGCVPGEGFITQRTRDCKCNEVRMAGRCKPVPGFKCKKSGGCFPGSATVHLAGGGTKQMKHLRLGDKVLTQGGASTEFLGWTDKNTEKETQFLRIVTNNGSSVTLTASHIIYVHDEKPVTKYAKDVDIGDLLVNLSGELEVVTDITTVQERGYYSPLTTAGDLFVDRLLTSCYSSYPHNVAHAALYPARTWPRLLLEDDNSLEEDGTRTYVGIIKKLGDVLSFRRSAVGTASWEWGEPRLAAAGWMITY